MADILFDQDDHKNIFFDDYTEGEMVSANQHLIMHEGKGVLLDPGGHKVYPKVFSALSHYLPPYSLDTIFLSHQDPDIVASLNGWLMVTDANALLPAIWKRFVAHFGVDGSVMDRLHGIPDAGMKLNLNGCELLVIPAHFLHSAGNFHLYDPISKILYTGDLGASIVDYRFVEKFHDHIGNMAGFHRRYMSGNIACRLWADMVRPLDIKIIAPQHGAIFVGKNLVHQFIDWVSSLQAGPEVMQDLYRLPE
ncbi:MAG: MBL fold metallo-hydrolase [Mariprofundales bacterium]